MRPRELEERRRLPIISTVNETLASPPLPIPSALPRCTSSLPLAYLSCVLICSWLGQTIVPWRNLSVAVLLLWPCFEQILEQVAELGFLRWIHNRQVICACISVVWCKLMRNCRRDCKGQPKGSSMVSQFRKSNLDYGTRVSCRLLLQSFVYSFCGQEGSQSCF